MSQCAQLNFPQVCGCMWEFVPTQAMLFPVTNNPQFGEYCPVNPCAVSYVLHQSFYPDGPRTLKGEGWHTELSYLREYLAYNCEKTSNWPFHCGNCYSAALCRHSHFTGGAVVDFDYV